MGIDLGLSGLFSGLSNIISTGMTNKSNQKINKQSLDFQNNWNKIQQAFAEKQFGEGVRQYEEQFGYQKQMDALSQSNYENQAQIRTNDLMKAGLNPMMYAGEGAMSLNPSVVSNVAGSSSPAGAPNLKAMQAPDLSMMSSLIGQAFQDKFERQEREKDRKLEREKLEEEKNKNMQDFIIANDELLERRTSRNMQDSRERDIAYQQFMATVTKNEQDNYVNLYDAVRRNDSLARNVALRQYEVQNSIPLEYLKAYGQSLKNNADFAVSISKLKEAARQFNEAKSQKDEHFYQEQFQHQMDQSQKMVTDTLNIGANLARSLLMLDLFGND